MVKVEEKKEGEEENPDKKEEENKEEEDGQEKKFNPKEFTWTLSNGCPKKTSQVYNKMKPVVWVYIISDVLIILIIFHFIIIYIDKKIYR